MPSIPKGTPPAEIEITPNLIRELLQSQHPDLADLPLSYMSEGWDNIMFRLGDEMTIRLPRREKAAHLLKNEQDWLPILTKDFPIPTPIPIRNGKPDKNYPWHWSVLPWLKGETANRQQPGDDQVEEFIECLKKLHQIAPNNAPANPYRGVPLIEGAEKIEDRLVSLKSRTNFITKEIEKIWQEAIDAPYAKNRCWIHGDLHTRNILVHEGKLSGIIDWGDMTSGDVANDLVPIWMLWKNPATRQRALDAYEVTPEILARAKGWVIYFCAVLLDTGLVDNPEHAEMGRITLERLVES